MLQTRALIPILFLAAGCTQRPQVALQPDFPEPLAISILPPSDGAGFWVNQPAYVAMFDVVPGEGVELMYPRTGIQLSQTVQSGSAYIRNQTGFAHRAYFASRSVPALHYIVAIASRKPLNIRSVAGFGEWMTYKLGISALAGTSLEMMNGIFEEVVPVQPGEDWATAVYVVYPNVRWRQNMYRLVQCLDGSVYAVNVEAPVYACPAPKVEAGNALEDNERVRRRDGSETARTGSAITRVMEGNNLPILRPTVDPLSRPPSPAESRRSLSSYSIGPTRETPRESGYTGRIPSPQEPSSQPAVTQAPTSNVSSPQADNGSAPSQPARRGSDPKDP